MITAAVAQEDYETRKHVKESEKRQMKEKRKTELGLGKVQGTKKIEGKEKKNTEKEGTGHTIYSKGLKSCRNFTLISCKLEG